MVGGIPRKPGLPEWIDHLGLAVWVTGPERRIEHLNPKASLLLGLTAVECLGRPCYDVVRGKTETGAPFCGPRCPLFVRAETGRDLEPVRVSVSGPRGRRGWMELIVIPVRKTPRSKPVLVHLALAADRNLHWIADTLHVSYVTVRNHVQHILEKLGTHSIPEAVARYLMKESCKNKKPS